MLQQKLKKIRDLKKLNKKVGEFISVTVKKDNSVKELIEKAKEEFYTKYSYLKPECEKNGLEKVCDGLSSGNVSLSIGSVPTSCLPRFSCRNLISVSPLSLSSPTH